MRRLLVCLGIVVLLDAPAHAQITFNFDFSSSPTYYTAAYQAAIQRAGTYAATQLDGRGTVTITFGAQALGGLTLANGGTSYFIVPGSKSNGLVFNQATTNNIGGSQGDITFDSGKTFFSGAGTSVGSGLTDLQSVALHELTHTFGFASLIETANGSSELTTVAAGSPDTYAQFDSNLRVGTATNANPVLTASNSFNTPTVTTADLNGTNIYFHGEFAKAANGGNAVLTSGGGDLSHLSTATTNGVMQPSIGSGTDRRAYTNTDLAILIDLGWNQFVWKNTTGNFADNVASTATARWQNLDGSNVLSPVGTITTNAVLRFGGTGGYTATNNLDLTATGNRYLLTRLILNATAGTSTIAATGSNAIRFDSTISVAPQVRQDGAGAFVISHALELTGRNLQLTGDGTGTVTLSGAITQQAGQVGSIAKSGTGTFNLGGANTYTGGTTITAGILNVNGQTVGNSGTGTGTVTINGGTLGGSGRIGGALTITTGTLAPGISGTGILTIDSNVTFASSGSRAFAVELNGTTVNTTYDRLNVNGIVTLNNATLTATRSGYTPISTDRLFVLDNDGTDAIVGTFNGLAQGASFDLNGVTAYISYQGNVGTAAVLGGNDIVIAFTPIPEPMGMLLIALGAWRLTRRPQRSA